MTPVPSAPVHVFVDHVYLLVEESKHSSHFELHFSFSYWFVRVLVLDMSLLSDIYIGNIFSQSVACLFIS